LAGRAIGKEDNKEIYTFGKIFVRMWCKLFALGSKWPFCAPVINSAEMME
jgi:hypothetical protein